MRHDGDVQSENQIGRFTRRAQDRDALPPGAPPRRARRGGFRPSPGRSGRSRASCRRPDARARRALSSSKGRAAAYLPMYPASAPAVQSSRMRSAEGGLRRRRRKRQLAPPPALVAGSRRCASSTRSETAPTIRISAAPPSAPALLHATTARRLSISASMRRSQRSRRARRRWRRPPRRTHKEGRLRTPGVSASPRASSCSNPNSRTVSSMPEPGLAVGSLALPQQVLLNERGEEIEN